MILQEDDQNPNMDLASFDTIYFAALQVFIVSSANGVRQGVYLHSTVLMIALVVSADVSNDGFRVLCVLLLFHCLHCGPQFLVDQSLCCCYHKLVLCDQEGYSEECLRCCTVSTVPF